MPEQLTVVISQGQSRNPAKRDLERRIADEAAKSSNVAAAVIPHLYDLAGNGESLAALQQIQGDIILLSWVYERAAHWILDRGGVRGQVGLVELVRPNDEEDEDEDDQEEVAKTRVIEDAPRPERKIFCIDLRVSEDVSDYVKEIARIAELPRSQTLTQVPTPTTSSEGQTLSLAGDLSVDAANESSPSEDLEPSLFGIGSVTQIEESPKRRWYPVIDFSRCTNCMECIDFCLFGVYGVDTIETILVEQPDNCRKGCPACSRVCPENAIIFPQHKSPAIAGAPVESGGLKIDLSKLFGAPESDEDAIETAARERDEQLLLAGRAAVGLSVGIAKRQENKPSGPKDELDNLLDELDNLDL